MLRIRVLGAAAGGGLPQWNCGCECCTCARRGERGVVPQTQSSIAASADGERWILCNASPDLRQQLAAAPALHPRERRHTPVAAVVLTNADVDHVAGLLSLRERQPFILAATARVHAALAASRVFDVLQADCVERVELALDRPARLAGLEVTPFAVPGKVALWLEDPAAGPGLGTQTGDSVALALRNPETGERAFYAPACSALSPELTARLRGAELVLFDGTLWRDDELVAAGLGAKTGRRMGHLSMSGEDGSLALFRELEVKRKVFIHLNNSNPVWFADSPERAAVREAGWEVACDGLELEL
jgi:pyrroloquinoline quinone biosynthesis protein B